MVSGRKRGVDSGITVRFSTPVPPSPHPSRPPSPHPSRAPSPHPSRAALIAEVILYSEGFESSKILAQKMTQMYKLSSEQLSQQDHYDFGMRAVKSVSLYSHSLFPVSIPILYFTRAKACCDNLCAPLVSVPPIDFLALQVLVMAGQLKRENPEIQEDLVLIRALRDSNLPKFLSDDAILFKVCERLTHFLNFSIVYKYICICTYTCIPVNTDCICACYTKKKN